VGSNLVTNVQNVNRLAEVQDNLQQAAAAVRAAQGVLEQCMAAGQLINEHQLYPALCMLDKIRRKHLGECARDVASCAQGSRSWLCFKAGVEWGDASSLNCSKGFGGRLIRAMRYVAAYAVHTAWNSTAQPSPAYEASHNKHSRWIIAMVLQHHRALVTHACTARITEQSDKQQ
jgi:hypothetical protein